MVLKYFSSLFILLFFIGCGGSGVEPIAYPSWYLNPPQNNGSFLYGVGEGKDIDAAKASALNSISASLSITVSSEFKKDESSSSYNGNEKSYTSAINRVKAEVKKIEFNDYQVIQNQMLSGTLLVLVEVSRHKLFNAQKEKLDRYSNELSVEQKSIKNYSPLKQAYLYEQSLEKTDKLKSFALLTKTINSDFDTQPYLNQVSDIQHNRKNALNQAKVSITSDTDAKIFIDTLKEGLNKAGIKTVSNYANTRIHLKNRFQTDEIYGFKIAKSTLSLSTLDAKNKTLATRTLTLNGKSRYDYEKAKLNTAHMLSQKIKDEGIFTLLGIQ